MDSIKEMIGKSIFVETKSDRKYSGTLVKIEDHFIVFIDKYGQRIMISEDEIKFIMENDKYGKNA